MSSTSRKSAIVLAAVLAASLAAGCASSGKPADTNLMRAAAPVNRPIPTQADLDATAQSASAFGLDVLNALTAPGGVDAGKNEMVSPASLATALAMLMPGARGQTASEIAKVLHTQLPADRFAEALGALDAATVQRAAADKATLQQFDTVWAQKGYGIQQAYLDLLSAAFDTGLHETDFGGNPEQSRKDINKTVEDQTAGLIKDLFGRGTIDPSTVLVLTDAVYLKAKWADAFPAGATTPQPFHRADGSTANVPMMAAKGLKDRYGSGPGWQAVELPYVGEHLAMDVVLPDAGTLDAFRKGLDGARLASIVGSMQAASVDLSLPKFTFDAGATLNDVLTALGMPSVFDPARADLGDIPAKPDQLYVGSVVEKTHVAVDEDGTTAAAAVGVSVEAAAAMSSAVRAVMNVDHPFLFLIRDTVSGQVLFLGQVTNPTG